jgi:serine/threonine protein kinase
MYRDIIQENLSFEGSQSSQPTIQFTPTDPPGSFPVPDEFRGVRSPLRKKGRSEKGYETSGQRLFDSLPIPKEKGAYSQEMMTGKFDKLNCESSSLLEEKPVVAAREQRVKLRSVVNHYLPGVPPKSTTTTLWLGNALEKPIYRWNFCEEGGELGRGAHSSVFVARHRLDGSLYAIKKLKAYLDEERPTFADVKEVCANVALKGCPNLVQYFGSWIEDNRLWIQMELCLRVNFDIFVASLPPPSLVRISSSCNLMSDMDESSFLSQGAASLPEEKSTPQRSQSLTNNDQLFSERAFWKVLSSISCALEFIHSRCESLSTDLPLCSSLTRLSSPVALAHMDIRPANLFITPSVPTSSSPHLTQPPFAKTTTPGKPSFVLDRNDSLRQERPPFAPAGFSLKRKISFPAPFPPPAPLPERTLSDCESVTCLTQHSLSDAEILFLSSQSSNPPFGTGAPSCPTTPIEELPPLEMSQSESIFETHRQKSSDAISAREVNENVSNGHWEVKLGDLGLCCRCDDYSSFSEGEERYCAPELIQSSGGLLDFTKADVFSLGASLLEMCLGRELSPGGDGWHKLRDGRFQRILSEQEAGRCPSDSSFAELMTFSEDARSILKQVPSLYPSSLSSSLLQMLSSDHSLRPDASFLRRYSAMRLAPTVAAESEAAQAPPEEELQHQVILSLQERIRALETEVEALKR